jgi:uncharacterized membrane protein YkvA (DUF1232 family)
MSKRLSYKNALKRASTILRDKQLSLRLVDNAKDILQSKVKISEKVRSAKKVFSDYIRLFKYYVNGRYRDISWKSMLYITAILIYFVTPTDVIPDFLPVTGFIDDATLALWLHQHMTAEMEKFLEWETTENFGSKIENANHE